MCIASRLIGVPIKLDGVKLRGSQPDLQPHVARGRALCVDPSGICSFSVCFKVTFAHPQPGTALDVKLRTAARPVSSLGRHADADVPFYDGGEVGQT